MTDTHAYKGQEVWMKKLQIFAMFVSICDCVSKISKMDKD